MKVVAINGSPRENGNTSKLLKTALKEIEMEGIETDYIQLGGEIVSGCKACMKCKITKTTTCSITTDKINFCIEKMIEANGIILGSPTYFADVTTEIKALIDRAGHVAWNNGGIFSRKIGAGIVSARRAGAIHAFNSITNFFLVSGMVVPGSTYWNMGFSQYGKSIENDSEGVACLKQLGKNIAWLLKLFEQEE